MALANINYEMNHVEDTAYIVIKNDPSMLEILFRGLFIVARRHLGYDPNTGSHPFMTRRFSESALKCSHHEREDLDYAMKNNIVITPDTKKHKNYEVYTVAVSGHINYIQNAIKLANQEVDWEDRLTYTDANINNVYMALIEDYWDDMLAFAKNNRHYMKNWQSRTQESA